MQTLKYFISLILIIFASFTARGEEDFNYCEDVSTPQEFILGIHYAKIPASLIFENVEDEPEFFEIFYETDADITAFRHNNHFNALSFGLFKQVEKNDYWFPFLFKSVNAQYETIAQTILKPSYYRLLFRLYPF